ncbi:MAG TPA: putative lipid II flippase FtsW, partial [Dermatophilaceae bacterium]|nr:putative lipid II flippase FtsW [Dermatophilaceae bacterium]
GPAPGGTRGPAPGGTRGPARGEEPVATRAAAWAARFESPVTTYYALLGLTAALVVFGLIMVLSASAIESLDDTRSGSAYTIFLGQLRFAAIGTIALVVASRLSVTTWKRLAFPAFLVAVALQLLVFSPLGEEVNGNRNWIHYGPVTLQPSELVKVGLILTGALVLTAKRPHLGRLGHVVVPYLFPLAAVAVLLVLLGHDLGTVLVIGLIIAATLYAAGVPARWFAFAFAAFAALTTVMVVTSANRLDRLDVWLGRDTNVWGSARQPIHGRYALADGGWFGLGLGASREKWNWLSEPHNDFIFAIIGEELGLPGTLVVLALFAALALVCYRLVLRSSDFFVRVATAGILAWIIGQAMINVGSVIGLLPVIGVPLPLVSSGGSSLVTTMLALGILLSFARAEPGCAEALSSRPSLVRRSVAVLPTTGPRRRARR